jgi:hypothetical protein
MSLKGAYIADSNNATGNSYKNVTAMLFFTVGDLSSKRLLAKH